MPILAVGSVGSVGLNKIVLAVLFNFYDTTIADKIIYILCSPKRALRLGAYLIFWIMQTMKNLHALVPDIQLQLEARRFCLSIFHSALLLSK
jgi:hypothetical protein